MKSSVLKDQLNFPSEHDNDLCKMNQHADETEWGKMEIIREY